MQQAHEERVASSRAVEPGYAIRLSAWGTADTRASSRRLRLR